MTFRWPWVLVMIVAASLLSRVLERTHLERHLVRHPEARDHLERQAWLAGFGRRPEGRHASM